MQRGDGGGWTTGANLLVLALVFAFALLVLAGMVWERMRDRDRTLEAATARTQQMAQIIEEHAVRLFQANDLTLRRIADRVALGDWDEIQQSTELWSKMAAVARELPQIRSIWLADAEGVLRLYSDRFPTPDAGRVIATRDYFLAHRGRGHPGLFVGNARSGVFTDQPFFAISIRIDNPDGTFKGIVAAAVEPTAFANFFRSIGAGPDAVFRLIHSGGQLLAAEPYDPAQIGQYVTQPALAALHDSGASQGIHRAGGPDGRRILAFQQIAGLPLLAMVGVAEHDALSGWRSRADRDALIVAAVTSVLMLSLLLLVRQMRREAKAEAELRRVDQRLRDAIESLGEGFVLWDPEDRLVLCNARYRDLYRPAADSLQPGVSYRDFLRAMVRTGVYRDEDCRDSWIEERMARHRDPPDGATELQLRDGRWLLATDRKTSEGGTVAVRADITAFKHQEQLLRQTEEARTRYIQELEQSRQKLSEQAAQLSELADKYAAERNRAEAANQEKTRFLATMSHELRTPLNAILGFSEVMRSEAYGPVGSPKYRDYAEDIHGSGQHLLALINDILDMSKVEAGKYELHREPVDLPDLIDETLAMLRRRAEEAGLALDRNLGSDLPPVPADMRSLRQILLNLLSNAIKFTLPGGRVGVAARLDGADLVIAVSDTGIGIPAADLARVVRPFEQVDNQLTRRHAGTGLGLALCKSLTELHGGELSIDSTEGQGTTVSVRIPMIPTAPSQPMQAVG